MMIGSGQWKSQLKQQNVNLQLKYFQHICTADMHLMEQRSAFKLQLREEQSIFRTLSRVCPNLPKSYTAQRSGLGMSEDCKVGQVSLG